jgi:hypothetical protein
MLVVRCDDRWRDPVLFAPWMLIQGLSTGALHDDGVDGHAFGHRDHEWLGLEEPEGAIERHARQRRAQVPPPEAVTCRVVSSLEDRPAQPTPSPVGANEHRSNVGGLRSRVEETIVTRLIARAGIEPAAAAPASAGNDLAADIVNDVGAVGGERRVDVGDVHCRAGGLASVVEPREQPEHRHPHHRRDRLEIGRGGDTQDRRRVAHAGPPRHAPTWWTRSATSSPCT